MWHHHFWRAANVISPACLLVCLPAGLLSNQNRSAGEFDQSSVRVKVINLWSAAQSPVVFGRIHYNTALWDIRKLDIFHKSFAKTNHTEIRKTVCFCLEVLRKTSQSNPDPGILLDPGVSVVLDFIYSCIMPFMFIGWSENNRKIHRFLSGNVTRTHYRCCVVSSHAYVTL